MPSVGLSEAARITGRNQSTVHRAMKAGRLSYTVAESGERRIDTAELDRVFGIKEILDREISFGATPHALAQPLAGHVTHAAEMALMQQLLDERDAAIRDLRADRDAWRSLAERLSLAPPQAKRRWWWGR